MQYTGQRFINAPLAKVWAGLQDAQTLASCFAAPGMVRQVSANTFAIAAPISDEVVVEDAQPMNALTMRGRRGEVQVQLAEETPQMTRLAYVVESQSTGLERQIEALLDVFQEKTSGPREIGASGLAGVQAI